MNIAKSEIDKLTEWLKTHKCRDGIDNPNVYIWQTSCSIGTNTYVKCGTCRTEYNITDYYLW